MTVDLSDYVEVPDRIREFFAKYPDGSLRRERIEYKELPAAHLAGKPCLHIIYHASAYRNPTDPKPGQGTASEPVPGLTPYTKGSELMNAETSAWGRALVALGFVGKKVASANEVRNRIAEEGSTSRRQSSGEIKPSDAQVELMWKLTNQQKATMGQLALAVKEINPDATREDFAGEMWPKRLLTGGREGTMSALITRLKAGDLPPVAPANVPSSDLDDTALVHPSAGDDSDVPFGAAA